MSKSTLNLIAAVCFLIATVSFVITGPLWLGILFAVLTVLSFGQAAVGRRRAAG